MKLKNPFNIKFKINLKILKRLIIVLFSAAVVFAGCFLLARTVGNVAVSNITDSFRKVFMSSSNGGWPYEIQNLNLREIKTVKDSIFLMYEDSAVFMTESARTAGTVRSEIKDARTCSKNGRTLVYDPGSGAAMLISRTEKLGQVNAGGKILAAAIGSNGSFALATVGEGHETSKIRSYSPSCKDVFEWVCGNERIIDAAFSADCKRLAVLAVGTKNAIVYSRTVVFDISTAKVLAEMKTDDCMMLRVCFTENDRIITVGDSKYEVYNKKYKRIDGLEYAENQLLGISFDDSGCAVIAFSQFGGASTRIIRYSASGEKTFEASVDGEVSYIKADGKKTAAVSGRTAYVYSRNGEIRRTVGFECVPDSVVYTSGHFFALEENTLKKY